MANIDYSSPYSDDIPIDPGSRLIAAYAPFVSEGLIVVPPEPFPTPNRAVRAEEEVDRIRHSLRREVSSKTFDRPVPLSEFCLVARAKSDASESREEEIKVKYYLIV
jgi:hypothetical protein